jgi:hypothetical protein
MIITFDIISFIIKQYDRKINKKGAYMIDKRLYSIKESSRYIGLGLTNTRKWLESNNCLVRIGGRVFGDRIRIDRIIDEKDQKEPDCGSGRNIYPFYTSAVSGKEVKHHDL